jgi:hypothetical protein
MQGYPVDRLLVSVWSPLYPKNLAITALKKRAPPPRTRLPAESQERHSRHLDPVTAVSPILSNELCAPQTCARLEACRVAWGRRWRGAKGPACRADEGRLAARSMLLQALMFMESYMERVKEEEKANGVRPPPSSRGLHCPRARDCTAANAAARRRGGAASARAPRRTRRAFWRSCRQCRGATCRAARARRWRLSAARWRPRPRAARWSTARPRAWRRAWPGSC